MIPCPTDSIKARIALPDEKTSPAACGLDPFRSPASIQSEGGKCPSPDDVTLRCQVGSEFHHLPTGGLPSAGDVVIDPAKLAT